MFDTLALFKAHVEVDAQQVYTSIDVIRAHVFRIYDEKESLEKERGDYTAANDQLMGENARLHAEVATLRTRMTPRMTPPISSIYEMPGPELHGHYFYCHFHSVIDSRISHSKNRNHERLASGIRSCLARSY